MREAPDVLMIGEIRDRETLKHALIFAQTGHLCLSTLHANNSYHALNRIVNFFPYDARQSILSDLSMCLRAIISQRLLRNGVGKQSAGGGSVDQFHSYCRTDQERSRSTRFATRSSKVFPPVRRPLNKRCTSYSRAVRSPRKKPCATPTPPATCPR